MASLMMLRVTEADNYIPIMSTIQAQLPWCPSQYTAVVLSQITAPQWWLVMYSSGPVTNHRPTMMTGDVQQWSCHKSPPHNDDWWCTAVVLSHITAPQWWLVMYSSGPVTHHRPTMMTGDVQQWSCHTSPPHNDDWWCTAVVLSHITTPQWWLVMYSSGPVTHHHPTMMTGDVQQWSCHTSPPHNDDWWCTAVVLSQITTPEWWLLMLSACTCSVEHSAQTLYYHLSPRHPFLLGIVYPALSGQYRGVATCTDSYDLRHCIHPAAECRSQDVKPARNRSAPGHTMSQIW